MRLAVVFPGQGSQSVGMLAGFEDNAAVQSVMERAEEALGEDLRRLIAEGPAEKLNLTVNTQPVMLAVSVAFFEAVKAAGLPAPVLAAGHSLGEYSALTAAGAISLEDAVPLVRFRASAMQEAVPAGTGGMTAVIGLTDEAVAEACREASVLGPVEAVNFNSPGQVVIAGANDALAKAGDICREKGAKRVLSLPVSAPFHSSMLRPASEKLSERLASVDIRMPAVPVIANVDASVYQTPDEIRAKLALQACSAVQWVKTLQKMKEEGVTHMVECGPGRVLAGLARRTVPDIVCLSVNSAGSMAETLEKLAAAA